MSLLSLIIVLAAIGLLMWAINNYVPMQDGIKKVLNVAVIVIIVLWLLSIAGILPDLNAIKVGG